MEANIPLRELGNIGKSSLVLAVGVCENYKQELVCEEIDYASCDEGCPFAVYSSDEKKNYCLQHCSHAPKKLINGIYINEKHRYKLNTIDLLEKKRLSKYQLLQFFLYHFLSVDKNGIIRYVSIKEVAKILGCTTRTVRNNNEVLINFGFISTSEITVDIFSVRLLNYKQYFSKKEDKGTGYIPVSKEFFQAILQKNNVNEMRLAIRKLIEDDNSNLSGQGVGSMFTYQNIKNFMPSYVRYKSAIEKIIDGTQDIFEIQKRTSFVEFKLKDEFNGRKLQETKENKFENEIKELLNENNIENNEKDVTDLVQLSIEYGFIYVKNSILDYTHIYNNTLKTPIKNLGGFIRELIRKAYLIKIGA